MSYTCRNLKNGEKYWTWINSYQGRAKVEINILGTKSIRPCDMFSK